MTTNTTETKRQRGRKVAAILAGGLVLGVGTMATLASWNDSEYASATFTAGKFVFQGSLDGTSFSDNNNVGAPAALSFTTPYNNLTPGDVVGAPFAVRLGNGTTNAAKVTLSVAATSGTVTNLTYEVLTTSSMTCTSATTGTPLVTAGTAMTEGTASFVLTKPATGSDGTPTYLCFKVTGGSGLQQSQNGSTTWQLQAVSQ